MILRPAVLAALAVCALILLLTKAALPRSTDAYLRDLRTRPGLFHAWLDPLRGAVKERIKKEVPPPYDSVARAILLGEQKDMPVEVRDSFSKSGTAHLLAISGGNVALVALSGIMIFRLLSVPRKASFAATLALLIFYCLLTGSAPSIVRATVMASIYLAGFLLRREPEILTSLAASALVILLWEPLQLFDLGFQLSFISVFMIAAATEGWEEAGHAVGAGHARPLQRGFLRKSSIYLYRSLGVSLAAWAGVAPLIARVFSIVSPVTIFANLLLVPFFTLLQAGGFIFLILGPIHPALEKILGASLYLLCRGALAFSDVFVALPMSHFPVRAPGNLELSVFYGLVLLWAFRGQLMKAAGGFKQRHGVAG